MQIKLKNLTSLELAEPDHPNNPANCFVRMTAAIGAIESDGADLFGFYVVTPNFLIENPETRWGHGYLLMTEFSWIETKRMVERIVAGVRADNWPDAANQLGRFLQWEYDGYTF